MKKRKISRKTIAMMVLFPISFVSLFVIAFSSMCLTWTGTVLLIALITSAGYSATYLFDRYEKISANDRKIELADNKNKKLS